MQDFFRCQPGEEARAARVANTACKKLVKDMHYEARVQAVVTYYGSFLNMRITKNEARSMSLTREQYLQVHISHCYWFPLRCTALFLVYLFVM